MLTNLATSGALAVLPGALKAVVSAGGIPQNPTIASLGSNPLNAYLGASRFAHGIFGTGNLVNQRACGQWVWSNYLYPNHYDHVWQAETLAATHGYGLQSDENSYALNGMYFAMDGQAFASMLERCNKIIASDAKVVVINAALGGVQIGTTVNSYMAEMTAVVDKLINAGKYVVVDQLWERGASAGVPWTIGSATRLLTPDIDAAIAAMAAARGVPVIPTRTYLSNPANNYDPYSYITRGASDETHLSNEGGLAYGKLKVDAVDKLTPIVVWPAVTKVGTFIDNRTMEVAGGTAGVINGAITGTLADGWVVTRQGSTSKTTMVLSQRSAAPIKSDHFGAAVKNWQRVTITGADTLTGTEREGMAIEYTIAGLTIGKYYQYRFKNEVSASSSWSGWNALMRSPSGGGSSRSETTTMQPINAGGTPKGHMDTDTLVMPSEAVQGICRSGLMLAVATSAKITINVGVRAGSGGTMTYDFTDVEVIEVVTPQNIMYNEADATSLVINPTSPSLTFDEESPVTIQWLANKTARWKMAGTDKAYFPTTPDGVSSPSAFDFENGAHAPSYAITPTAASFKPGDPDVTQARTVTINDINDGFTDNFNRANEALDASPNWTKGGAGTQTITITSNRPVTNGGTGRVRYFAEPQQGDTYRQQVRWTQAASFSSSAQFVVLSGGDEFNFVGLVTNTSEQIKLLMYQAGALTTLATYNYFAPRANFSDLIANWRPSTNFIEVLQGGVIIGEFDMSTILADPVKGPLVLSWKRSGMMSSASGGSAGQVDNWNNRVAAAITARLGLRALTNVATGNTTAPGTAHVPFELVLSGKTVGSYTTVVNLKLDAVAVTTGDFFGDGGSIRCGDPAPGTWTYDVVENLTGAAYDGRTTSFTSVIT